MDNVARIAAEEAEVAAHTMVLPRGTYCVHVVEVSAGLTTSQLPGLGISAAPGEEGTAVEIVRLSGEPWLRGYGDAVLVRVHAPRVRLLFTSYNLVRARGAVPPKIEVQRLGAQPKVVQPNGAGIAALPTIPAPSVGSSQVGVHVRKRGDQGGPFGAWIGERGADLWIEGFTIQPVPGLEDAALEYQGVFGQGWVSPWVKAGAYCGSRGMQLPILGLRVRLREDAEKRFRLAVSATFVDGRTHGPVGSDEVCALEPLQPVATLRVDIAERTEPAKTRLGLRARSKLRSPAPVPAPKNSGPLRSLGGQGR